MCIWLSNLALQEPLLVGFQTTISNNCKMDCESIRDLIFHRMYLDFAMAPALCDICLCFINFAFGNRLKFVRRNRHLFALAKVQPLQLG